MKSLGQAASVVLFFLLQPSIGHGSTLRSENSNATTQWSSGLKVSQDVNQKNTKAALSSLDLGYTYSLQQPDSSSNLNQWIVTNAEVGGVNFAWGPKKIWRSSFDVNLSSQPAENYSTRGFEWDLSRRFYFDPQDSEEDYNSSVKIGFKLGNTTLIEAAKVKIGKTLTNDLTEPQVLTGVLAKLYALENLSLMLEYDGYQYSNSISKLANYLNNNPQTKTSGFSTALGQLNIFSSFAKLEWDFIKDWTLALTSGQSDGLTSGVVNYWYEALLTWQMNSDYSIEAGAVQHLRVT